MKNPFGEGTMYHYLYEVYTSKDIPTDDEIVEMVKKKLGRTVRVHNLWNFKTRVRTGSFSGMKGRGVHIPRKGTRYEKS